MKGDVGEELRPLSGDQLTIKWLQEQLEETRRQLAEATYAANVAKWALVGVVSSRVCVQETMDQRMVFDARSEISQLADIVSKRCARHLLGAAEMEFRQHAEYCELRDHIMRVEGIALRKGFAVPLYQPPMDNEIPSLPAQQKVLEAPWGRA